MLSITLVSRLTLIRKAIDFVRNIWLPATEVFGLFSITFQKELTHVMLLIVRIKPPQPRGLVEIMCEQSESTCREKMTTVRR